MDLGLTDRAVLVAGSSRGIGLGIARSCLAEGMTVALTGRTEDRLAAARNALAEEFGPSRVCSISGDMCKTADIERALQAAENELGPLWGAVANVGLGPLLSGLVEDDAWDASISQNLDSAYRLARGAIRRMLPRREGAVILIGSIAGSTSVPGSPIPYSAGKAGINRLAKDLAVFSGPSNVRVNVIAPGNILFPGGEWERMLHGEGRDAWTDFIEKTVPLRRLGTSEEIGAVAAFLLSPLAGFVNGAVLTVDGGQSC